MGRAGPGPGAEEMSEGVPVTIMPTSAPPTNRRGASHSTPPFPASSDDEVVGKSSASSLILPSFDHSFPSFQRTEQEEGSTPSSRGSGIPQRIKHHSAERISDSTKINLSPVADNLSPWEEWFLCKEKQLRARFQARAMEEVNSQMEKRKQIQERENRRLVALEKHKEWVQKKNEEVKRGKKERERKLSQEMAEAAAKELEKVQTKKKAKEMYQEWLKKKKIEEVQKKKDEKEKEKLREAELQEKKEKSERMFKEWLQNPRNKLRPASAGYVYAYNNGKFPGQPDGNTYPVPAYYNPIPWKPVVMPPKEDKASTQVRLFGDNEETCN